MWLRTRIRMQGRKLVDFDTQDERGDGDYDKKKRQARFKNKNRRDAQKHNRQINREKVKAKAYRPRFDYDPSDYSDDSEDWESEWDDNAAD